MLGRHVFGFVLNFPSFVCPLVSNVGTVVDAFVHTRVLQTSLTARALAKRYNNISMHN